MKTLCQGWILHNTCFIYLIFILIRKYDLVIFDFYFTNLAIIDHVHECSIIHFFHLTFHKNR